MDRGDLDIYCHTLCSFRSSHQRCSMQKDVLRNFIKFTRKHQCQSLFFNKVHDTNIIHVVKFKTTTRVFTTWNCDIQAICRGSHQRCSEKKKGVLRNFIKFTGKHLCQSLFLNKKDTLAQLFSFEFYQIFKNTFFTEHLWTAVSIVCKISFIRKIIQLPPKNYVAPFRKFIKTFLGPLPLKWNVADTMIMGRITFMAECI